jgi:hypothetical protein
MKERRHMLRSVRVIILAASMVMVARRTASADGAYWSFKYQPSVPIGSVRSFVPKASLVGFDLDGRYWFARNVSIGLDATYTRLYDTLDHGTYPIDDGAVTATIYRHVDLVGLVPEAHFYFAPDGGVIPYVGLGAGLSSATFRILVSDLDVKKTNLGLIVSPEGGILIPVDRQGGLLLQALMAGARFSFSTAGYGDVKNTAFLSLQVGALVY